ncbi:MAG: FeoB-associated Cys-rich membrane protein [Eubacterium sp.]|nr:FeoB-associated Cys-rich membrane protein [Eubacterium sp.]
MNIGDIVVLGIVAVVVVQAIVRIRRKKGACGCGCGCSGCTAGCEKTQTKGN